MSSYIINGTCISGPCQAFSITGLDSLLVILLAGITALIIFIFISIILIDNIKKNEKK